MNRFSVAILLAGMGKRLRPYTEDTPKALLELCNGRLIIDSYLTILSRYRNNIDNIFVVVGYLKEKIIEYISRKYPELRVRYVVNNIYNITNTSYSLYLAINEYIKLNAVSKGMLIINGDVVIKDDIFKDLDWSESFLVSVDYNVDPESVKVSTMGDRVIEIGKDIDSGLEYIGIMYLLNDHLKIYYSKLRDLMSKPRYRILYYDDILNMVLNQFKLKNYLISSEILLEVDTLEDYKRARSLYCS